MGNTSTNTIPIEFGTQGKIVDVPIELYRSGNKEQILKYARSPEANVYNKTVSQRTVEPNPTSQNPTLANYGKEFVTAVNRPTAQLLDIATSPIQYGVQAAKQGTLNPQGGSFFSSKVPERGFYAGDTTTTRLISGAGELASMALPAGIYTRALSNLVAQNTTLTPTAFQGLMAEIGKVTVKQDVGFGLMAGFGGEAAVETGKYFDIGNEDINRLGGQILSPAIFASMTNMVVNEGRRLLTSASSSTDQLRGLKNTLYGIIDESGARLDGPSLNHINNVLNNFETKFLGGGNRSGFSNIKGIVSHLRKLSDESSLNYTALENEISMLKTIGADKVDTGSKFAKILANDLNDLYKIMKPTNPSVLGGRSFSTVLNTAREANRKLSNSETLGSILEEMRLNTELLGAGAKDVFRQIANRVIQSHKPGKSKEGNFTPSELEMFEEMAKGTGIQKTFEAFSKLGINSQDFLTTMLLSTGVSVGVGLATGGVSQTGALMGAGAFVAANFVGNISRGIANSLATKNAGLMRDLITAGSNSKNILQAYMKNIPKEERDPVQLATLFFSNGNADDILKLPAAESSQFVNDAVAISISMDQLISAGRKEEEEQKGLRSGSLDVPKVPIGF